jgi:CHAT domain-containing protein
MNNGQPVQRQFGLEVGGAVLDDFALFVASAREKVRTHPGRREPIIPEGAEDLRRLRRMVLGGLESTLHQLESEGYEHLIICPHGSTHFLPWHLLMQEETLLADRWAVTFLPSLELLRRRRDSEFGRTGAYALGMSFGGEAPHGQRALPDVPDELSQIASATGARALLDDEATEEALVRGLAEARWLHVATHGRHQVAAPAFQALFLAPHGASDGIINAYELLAHDLRGLELVTLSACESALGRFDIGDNLRGLPAALFQAGAQAIIGTLWEVNSAVSAFFFTKLYERLAAGDGRVEAFAAAQSATRERYPAFFHWAAFHYSGAW